jgi:hypothetical protein
MTQTPHDPDQNPADNAALPVPAGLDDSAPYAQWSVVECGLCGERSEVAEHAEEGQWDGEHAAQAHPGARMLPIIVWTISRSRGRTYLGGKFPRTTPTTAPTEEEATQ